MRARYFIIAAVVSMLIAALLIAPDAPYEGGTITVLYTGDTYGELESCG